MKKFVAAAMCIAISAIIWFSFDHTSSTTSINYNFADGPDKAHMRDYAMMNDPAIKKIPFDRTAIALRQIQLARTKTSRDFDWVNQPTRVSGRTRSVLINADGSMLVGSITGGLWRNNDFKSDAEWSTVDGLDHNSISSLVRDPNNNSTIFAGTGESHTAFVNYRESTGVGNGIFKSTDNGITWTALETTSGFSYVNDIVVRDEAGVSVVYAGVASGEYRGKIFYPEGGDGLFRSEDGGTTWMQVLPDIVGETEAYAVSDIEIAEDNTLYVGTMRNLELKGGGHVLKSSDGTNWEVFSDYQPVVDELSSNTGWDWRAGRVVLESAPSNPNHIYGIFMCGTENGLGQFRDFETYMLQTTDGGASWTQVELPQSWSNIPWHAASIGVDPNNENKVTIGALDMFTLNNASLQTSSIDWIRLSSWSAKYALNDPNLNEAAKDSIVRRYVHADIHNIKYIGNSSDEVVMSTDGGIFYSNNFSISNQINPEIPNEPFPEFSELNNNLVTTQYYHAALNPTTGVNSVIGGTQDNGSILSQGTQTSTSDMISGGDGGFSFWDQDNPEVIISTVYGNRYYIHLNGETHFTGFISGLFVNPIDYDDNANLLFSNMATARTGGLYSGLVDRFYDSLMVVNVNKFMGTHDMGLDTISFIKLNGNLTEAISAIKMDPHTREGNKTALLGTHLGKVYRTSELLSGSPITTRIDNGQLPFGYISSVAIGSASNHIMVTISNFGVESVWATYDGGNNWANLERNLPDIPVRWGVFNPNDDNKIMIATELGIWGLEDIANTDELWQQYSEGFPSVRVDMIELRKEDRTILAATHGRGIWIGNYDQGEDINTVAGIDDIESNNFSLYPNPAKNFVTIQHLDNLKVNNVKIWDNQGRTITTFLFNESSQSITVSKMSSGLYIVSGFNSENESLFSQRILIQ